MQEIDLDEPIFEFSAEREALVEETAQAVAGMMD